MPRKRKGNKRYPLKLNWTEVIALFKLGKYWVDFDEGVVYSGRTNKPVYTFVGGRHKDKADEAYLWCRVYSGQGVRSMPVAQAVWVAKTLHPIPPGFEVHHRDLDRRNNRWLNLFCLYVDDHNKLHAGIGLLLEEAPF